MKKLLVLFIATIFTVTLSACSSGPEEDSLSAIAPNGGPALSQVEIEYNPEMIDPLEYSIDIVSGADALVSSFGSESHNLIFAPVNLGANLYQSGVPYQLAAIISFGNLYFASTQSIDTLDDLNGLSITVFGQNAVPDIVVRTLINHHEFDEEPTINYVDSADAAGGVLQSDNEAIVLLAEPALSVQQANIDETLNTIDLQEAWETIFEGASYPQAGLFVHESISDEALSIYLDALNQAITTANDSPETIAEYAESLDYPFPQPILINAIPRSHLRFESAVDARDNVEAFFNEILELQPALIGSSLPDDEFYRTLDND